jgi:hypothetical protein
MGSNNTPQSKPEARSMQKTPFPQPPLLVAHSLTGQVRRRKERSKGRREKEREKERTKRINFSISTTKQQNPRSFTLSYTQWDRYEEQVNEKG